MPPKAQKEIVHPIKDLDHFNTLVNEENKKLVGKCTNKYVYSSPHSLGTVVDVHLTWCGPCKVLGPQYRGLFFSFSDPDKRLELYTVLLVIS